MTIYFDNSSTSYPKPEIVYKTLSEAQRRYVNPSRGCYQLSIDSQEALFEARDNIASFFHIKDSSRLLFTYNCTYGLNILLHSFKRPKNFKVAICPISHNAVYRPASLHAETNNYSLPIIHYHPDTTVDLNHLETVLQKDSSIQVVFVTHVSNVSGEIAPVKEIAQLVHAYDRYIIIDGAQSAGHFPVDIEDLQVDGFSFSGHKSLYGPQGVGGFYISERFPLQPFFAGGTGSYSEMAFMPSFLPDQLEPGTANLPGILALSSAIHYLKAHDTLFDAAVILDITKRFLAIEGIKIVSPQRQRVPIFSWIHDTDTPDNIAQKLSDEYNIATRYGLHCSPVAHKSFGTFPDGTIRISLGIFNTKQEVDLFFDALRTILKK